MGMEPVPETYLLNCLMRLWPKKTILEQHSANTILSGSILKSVNHSVPRFRPFVTKDFNGNVLTFHDRFQCIRMRSCSWQVGFPPHSSATVQITLSSDTPHLSWSWVDCFHISWNEPSLQPFHVVYATTKFWNFIRTELSSFYTFWGSFTFYYS